VTLEAETHAAPALGGAAEAGASSRPGNASAEALAAGASAEALAAGGSAARSAQTTTIAAVLVSYDESPEQLRQAVDSLLAQTRAPAEILIIDNNPGRSSAPSMRGYAAEVRLIEPGSNIGYAPAINLAASHASSDYVLTLNPDAHVEPDCLERMAAVADSDPQILLVGAQILLEDGITRNAGANPMHPTGISPAGGFGKPREQGEPRDVAVVSGACCLIRREAFLALGGFVDEFFVFYDDPDMGWRALIAGMRVVYCPDAAALHGYDFERRGRHKWFLLERNRLFSLLANYEARTLALLSPLLIATEIGLWGVAAYGGWLPQKLQTYASVFALRKRLTEQRRAVQASRRRSDREVLELFETRMDSALLPPPGPALANAVWVPYMRLVRPLLAPAAPGSRAAR
jgi:N-acetylglucosaminyl-diphospho-decaprenol L-rhamnosyltransferase